MISTRLYKAKEIAYQYPLQPIVLAVTGTNGKTSTVELLRQILSFNDIRAASIGTLGCLGAESFIDLQERTTPGPHILHPLLHDLSSKVSYVAMEASSHALDQYRMHCVKVRVAGFTNLTQDHMDYHKSLENYFCAKARLFKDIIDTDGVAVINQTSSYFNRLVQKSRTRNIISYGTQESRIHATDIQMNQKGLSFNLVVDGKSYPRHDPIYGEFQIENILCATGMVLGLGIHPDQIPTLTAPKGRLEKITTINDALVFVDYAHTPDALLKSLLTLKKLTLKNLWVVFGCGGDRDAQKRPLMGQIASTYAHYVVVTDDNPRFENPLNIRREILSTCTKGIEIPDRREAIFYALKSLAPGDALLVAGKGHENGQSIKGITYPFSDHDVILRY